MADQQQKPICSID